MIKRMIIAIVLLGVVGGGLVWFNFFRDRMIEQFFADMPVQTLPVDTLTAEPSTWRPTIGTIGTAHAAQGVDLTVEAAGIVREILFSSNDRVESGQLLLRLDSAVQSADLEAATTQLETEELNLVRTRELQSRGVATSVSLEGAQAAYRAAQAQVARVSALLDQRQLVAPFAGTIGLPRVDVGEYVSPGAAITTLQDIDSMRVDFSLPEQQLPNVFIGQDINVRIEGRSAPFEGEITGIDPRVDPASRMFAIRATISDAGGEITPGQFVRIEVALPQEDDVIAVPQTALVTSLYGDFVYLVEPDPENEDRLLARQVFVTAGRRAQDMVEIREGLEAGATIVATGQNRLSNNTPVSLSGDTEETEGETAAQAVR
ncbi:MAG: efflux RND transporter periplasmic adaptor subunit [Salinarimonas sp.]|nr:efflux RND transporter periplasmic adaptor subunit [Salinarimonas sp.]